MAPARTAARKFAGIGRSTLRSARSLRKRASRIRPAAIDRTRDAAIGEVPRSAEGVAVAEGAAAAAVTEAAEARVAAPVGALAAATATGAARRVKATS